MATIFGLNLPNTHSFDETRPAPARVAIFTLASDFGCQINITNIEDHLLDLLGMFDLVYWQLAGVGDGIPEQYDVAIIEGAVTNTGHVELLKQIRSVARVVIAIGACAVTGGIPGLSRDAYDERIADVYGEAPSSNGTALAPCPVSEVIDVDYIVPGCPIDPTRFVGVLQRALLGCTPESYQETLCGSCRLNEHPCFYTQGRICLGLVTATGCGAKCVDEGRPCNGCRGLAKGANLEYAREVVRKNGLSVEEFDRRLALFNSAALDKEA